MIARPILIPSYQPGWVVQIARTAQHPRAGRAVKIKSSTEWGSVIAYLAHLVEDSPAHDFFVTEAQIDAVIDRTTAREARALEATGTGHAGRVRATAPLPIHKTLPEPVNPQPMRPPLRLRPHLQEEPMSSAPTPTDPAANFRALPTPLERADYLQKEMEAHNWTREAAAEQLGISSAYVDSFLVLARADEATRQAIRDQGMAISQAFSYARSARRAAGPKGEPRAQPTPQPTQEPEPEPEPEPVPAPLAPRARGDLVADWIDELDLSGHEPTTPLNDLLGALMTLQDERDPVAGMDQAADILALLVSAARTGVLDRATVDRMAERLAARQHLAVEELVMLLRARVENAARRKDAARKGYEAALERARR